LLILYKKTNEKFVEGGPKK